MFSVLLPFFNRPELLKASLLAMDLRYNSHPFEVIVIDDVSAYGLKPDIPENLNFPVKVVTLHSKTGINPCVPYNVGAQVAEGKYFVLSSPEIVPTFDVLSLSSEIFEAGPITKGESPYLLFDVFTFRNQPIDSQIIAASNNDHWPTLLDKVLNKVKNMEGVLSSVGENRKKPWSNRFGTWYQHHTLRPLDLNFLGVISRDLFFKVGGFCERFRAGTGYDDLNFRDNVRRKTAIQRVPGFAGIHLNHDEVSSTPEHAMAINSNRLLYLKLKALRLRPKRGEHSYSVNVYPGS